MDLLPKLADILGQKLTEKFRLTGAQLAGSTYRHVLADVDSTWATPRPVVVGGDYVTTESGTGLVHTAPGHGVEDFATGNKLGLEAVAPVDDGGRFTAAAGPF